MKFPLIVSKMSFTCRSVEWSWESRNKPIHPWPIGFYCGAKTVEMGKNNLFNRGHCNSCISTCKIMKLHPYMQKLTWNGSNSWIEKLEVKKFRRKHLGKYLWIAIGFCDVIHTLLCIRNNNNKKHRQIWCQNKTLLCIKDALKRMKRQPTWPPSLRCASKHVHAWRGGSWEAITVPKDQKFQSPEC